MFDAQEVTNFVVAAATVAAAVFAGRQVRELVRQQRQAEQLETRAVSVMWQAKSAPHKPDGADGTRTIRATFDADVRIEKTMSATVAFDDMHGRSQVTTWPRSRSQQVAAAAH
ncbi:hypothetical protein [Promicromonospora aerolata]|uniref:Secreted protein n=1 Tax=Promicromonospora aerolata TaxID=195749 RepID=A0ABW4VG08_9MICO